MAVAGGRGDHREAVFAKVTEVLADEGSRGTAVFVIEMVPGMLPGEHSPWWWEWISEQRRRAPIWEVRAWPVNSSWHLPQVRARNYSVGYDRQHADTPLPPAPTSSDIMAFPLPLATALNLHLPPVREQPLTFQQLANRQGRKAAS